MSDKSQAIEQPPEPVRRHEPNATLWDVGAEEYHADRTHLSCGALSDFGHSIRLYYRRYITHEMPVDTSNEMHLGSAFHLRLLQPHLWSEKVAYKPDCDKRSNANKEIWRAFEADNADKIQIAEKDLELIDKMVESVKENSEAAALLDAPGLNEQAVRWVDPYYGMPCRMLADRILTDGTGTVINVKTSADPLPEFFARQCINLGYHNSAAWYQDGGTYLHGSVVPMVFVVVATSEPYETVVYELDEEAVDLGRAQNRRWMAELRDCTDLMDWTPRLANKRNRLSLPRWAFSQSLAY